MFPDMQGGWLGTGSVGGCKKCLLKVTTQKLPSVQCVLRIILTPISGAFHGLVQGAKALSQLRPEGPGKLREGLVGGLSLFHNLMCFYSFLRVCDISMPSVNPSTS